MLTLMSGCSSMTAVFVVAKDAKLDVIPFIATLSFGALFAFLNVWLVHALGQRVMGHLDTKIASHEEFDRHDERLMKVTYVVAFAWAFVAAFLAFSLFKFLVRIFLL